MSSFASSLTAAVRDARLTVEAYRELKARALRAALAGRCRTPTEAARFLIASGPAELRQLQRRAEAQLRASPSRRLSPA